MGGWSSLQSCEPTTRGRAAGRRAPGSFVSQIEVCASSDFFSFRTFFFGQIVRHDIAQLSWADVALPAVDPIVSKKFYFAEATRQSAEALLKSEPHKIAIVRPSTQPNSLSISWAEPDRVRHSLVERAGTTLKTQVDDGSVLYFDTIESLLSHLKLVPFGSHAHTLLRKPPPALTAHVDESDGSSGSNLLLNATYAAPPEAVSEGSSSSPPRVRKPAVITREQAEAAGYSVPPDNLKQLREKKLAERNAQLAADAAASVATAAAANDSTVLVAASPVPAKRRSFEDASARLNADDHADEQQLGSSSRSSSSRSSAGAAPAADDDDLDEGYERFKAPLTLELPSSGRARAGTEDLFENFAQRYDDGDEPKLSSRLADIEPDESDGAESHDSSLPPYVYQNKAPRAPSTAAPVPPAAAVAATAPPTATAAATATPPSGFATSEAQFEVLEKLLDRMIGEPSDMQALEMVRGLLLQSVRRVNTRIDDLLASPVSLTSSNSSSLARDDSKKSHKKSKSGGSSKRKSKKK